MKILESTPAKASANMEKDAKLLQELAETRETVLHFYDWERPSATYGYFLDPYSYLKENSPLDLARRPTGGGIIFHETDFAFSILIPASHPRFSVNTLANYRFVHELVAKALMLFDSRLKPHLFSKETVCAGESCPNFCMATPAPYDVMIGEKKIAGGAHRRTRSGFLHQGSIFLAPPDEEALRAALKDEKKAAESILANSHPLIASGQQLDQAKQLLKEILIAVCREA